MSSQQSYTDVFNALFKKVNVVVNGDILSTVYICRACRRCTHEPGDVNFTICKECELRQSLEKLET